MNLSKLVAEAEAARGRDWPQAAAVASELRACFPDNAAGYRVGAAAARELRRFDEAATILTDASKRFPEAAWPLAEAALTALARVDLEKARVIAADLRQRFPANPVGYQAGAAAARRLRRLDEAAAILTEAHQRFPGTAWALAEAGHTALARGDPREAMTIAAELRQRFPANPVGHQVGTAAAREMGRLDEEAALLAEARTHLPAQFWPLAQAASNAQARGDREAVSKLAAELRDRFPEQGAGYRTGAVVARETELYDEAETIVAEARRRFPDEAWPLAEAASIALARGDRETVILAAAELRHRFPEAATGYRMGALAARETGMFDEAAAIIEQAQRRFPSADWPRAGAARIARARVDAMRSEKLIVALRRTAPARRKVVVVLGMHRAGTSVCTRVLRDLGVALGDRLMTGGRGNPGGHYEFLPIVKQHETLFGSIDADWDSPRSVRPLPHGFWRSAEVASALDRLKPLVADQLASTPGPWGFKDPRTVRFLPLWRRLFDQLDVDPIWILAVRDPRAVAASLYRRDGIKTPLGELLWLEHYLDALRNVGARIACIVHYERWFSSPRTQLEELAAAIGGATDAAMDEAHRAIRAELRHEAPSDNYSLPFAERLHASLLVENPEMRSLRREAASMWRQILDMAARSMDQEAETGVNAGAASDSLER